MVLGGRVHTWKELCTSVSSRSNIKQIRPTFFPCWGGSSPFCDWQKQSDTNWVWWMRGTEWSAIEHFLPALRNLLVWSRVLLRVGGRSNKRLAGKERVVCKRIRSPLLVQLEGRVRKEHGRRRGGGKCARSFFSLLAEMPPLYSSPSRSSFFFTWVIISGRARSSLLMVLGGCGTNFAEFLFVLGGICAMTILPNYHERFFARVSFGCLVVHTIFRDCHMWTFPFGLVGTLFLSIFLFTTISDRPYQTL